MSQQTGLIDRGGASSADDPTTLLPCLKERTWRGREHSVCRVLWPNQASAYMPWVAVGYDHPHSFTFVTTQDFAPMQTTEAALEARALANLRRRSAKWEKVNVNPGKGSRFSILACLDDFLAAERILDPDFMKEAQRTLRARGLLVGIPRRGRLFCIDGELQPDAVQAFGIMVAQEFTAGESAEISPMLFAVKDGEIVGIVEAVADAILPELQKEQCEAEQDENAPYITSVIVRNDRGTEDVHLMVGGMDASQLANGVQRAVFQVLHGREAHKEFSGTIKVIVLGHTPDEAKVHIPDVIAHLQGYCGELSGRAGKTFSVSVEYQKNSWPEQSAAPAASRRAEAAPVEEPAPSMLSRVIMWIIGGAILYALKLMVVSLL
jgi:hypothetical protein